MRLTTGKVGVLGSLLMAGIAALAFAGRPAQAQPTNWCSEVPLPFGCGTGPCKPLPHPGPPCECCEGNCRKSPVYVSSGAYTTSAIDLSLPAAGGAPLQVGRRYDSSRMIDGPLGIGWSSSLTSRVFYAVYLLSAPSTYSREAQVTLPDGTQNVYIDNGNGTFTPPLGRYDVLVRNADGSFDLTLQRSRTVYHYLATGPISSMRDDYGNTVTFTYDGSGKLQQVADGSGSGRYINVYWGANGRISSIQDSAGRQVVYGYGAQGNLATVTDPLNRVTTYGTVPGRFVPLLASITDNWGRATTNVTYDSGDRTKTFTENGETFTYTYKYTNNPNKTSKADSSGNTWVFQFGADPGLVTDDTPPPASGVGVSHTDFDSNGNALLKIDPVGTKTSYAYGTNGTVSSVTKDYQGTTAVRFDYAYDPAFPDKVSSITPKNPSTGLVDPNWQGWRYVYWQAGDPAPGALRYVKRVESDGTTLDTLATYSYDAKGRVSQQLSASSGATDYAYDPATGNLLTVTSPSNNDGGTRPVTTYGNYDQAGRARTITDPRGHATTYTFDALGRVLTVTLPPPSQGSGLVFTTTYSYDNWDAGTGLLFTYVTDPNGKVTKLGYDQYGRLVQSIDASNKTTVYAYTKDLLTSITDANNNATSYFYDSIKRLIRTTFPDNAYEAYTYWGDGLLKTRTDRKNQTLTYAYDGQKRLKTKTYPNATTVTYTYTGQKLTSVVDTSVTPSETHSFGYDASYRVASNTQGPRGTISYTYLPNDRPQTMTAGSGPTATYAYYPDDSLNTITWSPVAQPFKYTYNLSGQYDVTTFPNGQTKSYFYDDQGRLTSLANVLSGTTLATYSYGYDLDNYTSQTTMLGQRTSLMATVPSQGFSSALTKYYYDVLYQLTRADYPGATPFGSEIDSWTYDDIGNRLTQSINGTPATYTYVKNGANPLNGQRLLNDGTNAYTWDANGSNLTRNGTPGNFTFGYNVDNRLTSITGAAAASYTYDYQGRRTTKTVSGTTTTYLYDGLNLVTETTGGSATNYVFGPGIDEPLATYQAGALAYYSADALGTTTLLSNASGTVQNSQVFDAWGLSRSSSASLVNSFGYTARELGEAGLTFYRARFLQAGVGRFTAEDPLGPDVRASFHAYGSNGPVLAIDPLGQDEVTRDDGARRCFYCLWMRSGFGSGDTERSAWIVKGPDGGYGCVNWPWTGKFRSESWPGDKPWPPGVLGIGHTHPRRTDPRPSPGDGGTAESLGKRGVTPGCVYTITREAIWKICPGGGVTREEDGHWHDGFRGPQCPRCD